MNELIQYQKPELIILAEKKKLRDYQIETRNALMVKFIAKLLNLLGVNDGKTDQHNALALHVSDYYGHYTFEQMDKAFGLFVLGTFKTKPFQQLNAVVFGQVMSEYSEYEKEQTKIYKMKLQEFKETSNQIPESEKDELMENAIKEAIEVYKNTSEIELAASKYDWLFSKGLIQNGINEKDFDEIKKAKYASVKMRLIEVYSKIKSISVEDKAENKKILQELQEKVSGNVVYQCKLELLQDYFNTKI